MVNKEKEALSILNTVQQPLVVKADGLAAGKGVTVPETVKETEKAELVNPITFVEDDESTDRTPNTISFDTQ